MSPSRADWLLLWTLRFLAAIAGSIVLLIFGFLLLEAWPMLAKTGWQRFFTDESWHPTSDLFNLSPMLWGSLAATAGAMLLAVPLGLGSAIFCQFYAPPTLGKLYRRMIELMGGVPSVIYGFWGLMVLVPWIGQYQPPGSSLLAGILILALMILPTMALTADAALAHVAPRYLQTSAALGLSRWAMIRGVVLPAAKSGLFSGMILAMGRAIGETMAVLMVCGNQVIFPHDLLEPVRTLTANIALEMAYATGDHRAVLFVCGLILVAMVSLLVIAAEMVDRKQVRDEA